MRTKKNHAISFLFIVPSFRIPGEFSANFSEFPKVRSLEPKTWSKRKINEKRFNGTKLKNSNLFNCLRTVTNRKGKELFKNLQSRARYSLLIYVTFEFYGQSNSQIAKYRWNGEKEPYGFHDKHRILKIFSNPSCRFPYEHLLLFRKFTRQFYIGEIFNRKRWWFFVIDSRESNGSLIWTKSLIS